MSLHFNAFFLAYPVEPTRFAAHSKYCGKREHQCGDDVVYDKTETKPFTQNAYLSRFLEGRLSPLHSRLTQERRMFRKHVKLMYVQLLKNTSRDLIAVFPIPLHLMFLNEKVLFVIGFRSLVLNYTFIHDAFCF